MNMNERRRNDRRDREEEKKAGRQTDKHVERLKTISVLNCYRHDWHTHLSSREKRIDVKYFTSKPGYSQQQPQSNLVRNHFSVSGHGKEPRLTSGLNFSDIRVVA